MAQRNLNAAALSRRAGLNPRAVKDIEERRTQSPRLSSVVALASALDVTLEELLGLRRTALDDEIIAFLCELSLEEQAELRAALQSLAILLTRKTR